MPRNITVTFADGSNHVYQNAPDTLTPQDVAARAASDFGGKSVTNIDGGNPNTTAPQPSAAPAPSMADSVMDTIKSAASSVADAASGVAGWLKPAITSLAHSSEASDSPFAASTVEAPPPAPAPMSHGDMIDAASAGGIPVGPPAPTTKAVIPHTEAVGIDQAAARRKAWDDVPQGLPQVGWNSFMGESEKVAAGVTGIAADALDSDSLREKHSQYMAIASQRINRAMQGNEDSYAAQTVARVASLAPLLMGAPAGISSMVSQAGINGYNDAREAGDSPGDAIARGTAVALANYVGVRTQLPGLTGALTKAISGAPAGDAIAALGHALVTNVGGMEATTALTDLYDKMAPGGLKPNMTAEDMVRDIADTAKSAALLTLAVPGIPLTAGHLFHAAHALAHGRGNAEAARAIDGANPPPADAAPTTTADATATAPPAPLLGLDTLHDSIDEAARTVGLSPKATAALRDAAAQRDPQDAAAFVARAFHRMEANGLTNKAGAPGAFRDALAQRIADQQPEPPPAPKGKPSGKPSAADQLTAIRPLDAAPAADTAPAAEADASNVKPDDLTTSDGMPYGTRASAVARATREGGDTEVAQVDGGWVVRPIPREAKPTEPAAEVALPAPVAEAVPPVEAPQPQGIPDERAQPDVAEPAGVPAGASDGGSGPAVASSGDLGQDAPVAAGRGVGGDATAPAGGARAAAAVDAGGGADAALKPAEPAPRLLGKSVTAYETPALQKIASMKTSSARAREVASAEIARRAAQPVEPTPADQAAPVPQADEALTKQGADTPRAGIDPATLRSEVTRIQAGWKDAPPVHVVDDVSELPQRIQDALHSQGAKGNTRGLLMPGRDGKPGQVYLIANRLANMHEAQKTLFHEVLGHYGIRKVLGSDAIYSAEMYKLRQANPALASEAEAWMQHHGQGAIADRMSRGLTMDQAMKVVRALSTEEALADRAGRGEPIRGLQSLMAKIQTWLRSVGLDNVADHLEKMTQAETAALLARARRAVEMPAADGEGHANSGLEPALTSRPVREEGIPQGAAELGGGTKVDELKSHPDYKAAKAGDTEAAVRLVNDLVSKEDLANAKKLGPNVVYAFPHAEEASGRNAIPLALAHKYAHETGGEVEAPIVQTNRVFHTGADAMQRLSSRPLFDGSVQRGRKYVVVDDVSTMGSTLAELADHIRAGGGDVVGVATLADANRAPTMVAPKRQTAEIESRYGQTVRDELHVDPRALTGAEAGYLIGFRNADELRNRVATARRDQEERARARTLREGDAPLLSQHAADDAAAEPDTPKSHVAEALDRAREAGAKFADTMKAIRDDALLKTVPMSLGNTETRTIAKDFANADRLASWQWGKFDDVLTKHYDEAQRRDMFNASDEQSVLMQQGKKVGPDEGLNSLSPDERKTVETLQGYGDGLLERAKATGMFEGEGIPSWTPRMAVMVDGRGGFTRPKGAGAETGAKQGRNILTTASSLKARKYLTSAETEAAMKGKLGDGAQLVRDIRVMPLAMARLEKAIAGRELLNQIKAMGDRAGLETVSSSAKDGFFTVDHPAFKTWQATTAEDGTKSWEAKPLYVNKAFEGPLKAVMSETPGPVYSALMALKSKSMGLIMYSPLIHNAVEWGRALPAMPGKVATFQIYFEGNRIKNDPVQMRQAISDGLVPIGKRGGIQDITGIMEDPSLTPGRSWTAKLLGGAMGIAEPVSKPAMRVAGKAADLVATPVGKAVSAMGAPRLGGAIGKTGDGIASLGTEVGVKKAIDAAGDFWHNTLLWDRVGDLQAGLYGAMREKEIAKGTDPVAAGKLAAHFANRFAGALPNEAMSAGARKVANLLMFSRTFTLGNMGLMKDMITGLPRDVQAQIRTASGDLVAAAATSRARRIAIASFIVDIGLMYVGNSLMQDAIKHMKGDKTWGEIGQGYLDRLHKLMQKSGDHPLETLSNPFEAANSLSSTSENEPGKEDRIRVGTQDDGTAIYMRLPTGKVGEDFKNWITKPLITAKAKESQLVRPLQALWNNDNGIGQRIYDPDAKGLGGVLSNAGRIAKLFATQMIPADAIKGAIDWKTGTASDVDKLKVVGPLAGLTFSKGAPGGPEVGQMYESDRKFLGAKMDVMPDVKAALKAGDDEKAVTLLEGIKMTPAEINSTLRRLKVPESRMNAGAFRRFSQHASDEDMARMMQLLQGEQHKAASATAAED